MLRDLDGDNVAIVDTRGAASGQQLHLLTLAAEWRYDAYGSVNWSRVHGPHPVLACGHRGVFFDRLDEPVIRFVAEAASGDAVSAAPALGQSWDTRVLVEPQVAGAGFDLPTGKPKIIGHMRNREYLPHLMRFAQRDPNATGQLVMAAVEFGGKAMANDASAIDLMQLYGDGASLYAYLGGNPRSHSDPNGLNVFALSPGAVPGAVAGSVVLGAALCYVLMTQVTQYSDSLLAGVRGSQAFGRGLYNAAESAFARSMQLRGAISRGYDLYNLYRRLDSLGIFSSAEADSGGAAKTGAEVADVVRQTGNAGTQDNVRTLPESDMPGLFDELARGGKDVTPASYKGKMVELPDGTRVGMRDTSQSGGRTIDVQLPNGKSWKIHRP